jgi:hypothetical protein
MLSLPDYLRPATARAPLTIENFVFNVVPPVVCYFITAFLVLLPRTQPIRVAIWPIMAFLAFRAAGSMASPKQFLTTEGPDLHVSFPRAALAASINLVI